MDSNFSPKVKEIISYSREEALRLGNDFIGTEHLLLGLIREGDGLALRVLQAMQVDLFDLRKELEMAIKDKNNKPLANINSLTAYQASGKSDPYYRAGSKGAEKHTVETEHLMLSILKNKENVATQILAPVRC
jgi:ATP-dependent Clp protease ATP-binding subunit ClpC